MIAITKKELEILLAGGCIKNIAGDWRDVGDTVAFYEADETPIPEGRDGFVRVMESTLKAIFPAYFIIGGKRYGGTIVAKQKLSKDAPWWHGWIGRKTSPRYLYIIEGMEQEPEQNPWEKAFSVEPGSINKL